MISNHVIIQAFICCFIAIELCGGSRQSVLAKKDEIEVALLHNDEKRGIELLAHLTPEHFFAAGGAGALLHMSLAHGKVDMARHLIAMSEKLGVQQGVWEECKAKQATLLTKKKFSHPIKQIQWGKHALVVTCYKSVQNFELPRYRRPTSSMLFDAIGMSFRILDEMDFAESSLNGHGLFALKNGQALLIQDGHRYEANVSGNDVLDIMFTQKDYKICLFDESQNIVSILSREQPKCFVQLGAPVRKAFWSPSGKLLCILSDAKGWILDDAGSERFQLLHDDYAITFASWNHDATKIATIGNDSCVRIWDMVHEKEIAKLQHGGYHIESVAWNYDGSKIATRGGDYTVKLWTETGKLISMLEHKQLATTRYINLMAWNPRDSRLCTVGYDYRLRIWDAAGKQLAEMNHGDYTIDHIAWSPRGSILATGGYDYAYNCHTVKLWDSAGNQLTVLKIGNQPIKAIVWNPAATLLCVTCVEGNMFIWQLSTGVLEKAVRRACIDGNFEAVGLVLDTCPEYVQECRSSLVEELCAAAHDHRLYGDEVRYQRIKHIIALLMNKTVLGGNGLLYAKESPVIEQMSQKSESPLIEHTASLDLYGMDPLIEKLKLQADIAAGKAKPEVIFSDSSSIVYGPPGSGKTTLARYVADYLDWPLVAEIASNWERGVVGASAEAVREFFAKVRLAAPCVLFIDEIDTMRGSGPISNFEVIETFATEMQRLQDDRRDGKIKCFNIAATNYLSLVDATVLLRFYGHRICVDVPDQKARKEILRAYLRKIFSHGGCKGDVLEEDFLDDLASKTKNFSGRGLKDLLDHASDIAILKVKDVDAVMTREHLLKALAKDAPGVEAAYQKWLEHSKSR